MKSTGLTALLILMTGLLSFGQDYLVFNKTEHDFGTIAASEVAFEHDFLFRNTGDSAIRIASVRAASDQLKFIYTRSEVLAGEYGFVKVKLQATPDLGLFHDEIYVTTLAGSEVNTEIIYIRAQVDPANGAQPNRQFQDSDMAISVEVSPDDIETMEGFLGDDQLARAASEIEYLRHQVALKSELLAKMSADLRNKESFDRENIQTLAQLEESVNKGDELETEQVLGQIKALSQRLISMHESDSALREEILEQENIYADLKHQADSARAYARDLSHRLQEQFVQQAAAMEKANRLEADLERKKEEERRQQDRIDSLEQHLSSLKSTDLELAAELKKLKADLAWKQKEQAIQSAHAEEQQEKIEALRRERENLLQQSDSLAQNLENRSHENQRLADQLQETTTRITHYQSKVDSLKHVARYIDPSYATFELDSLTKVLAYLEQEDQKLKGTIAAKDLELRQLEDQKSQTQKDLKALKNATNRQLEETHNLMYRINQLSSKESSARMEVAQLKDELERSRERENATKQMVNRLNSEIASREASVKSVSDSLLRKQHELDDILAKQDQLESEYLRAKHQLEDNDGTIDSLQTLANQSAKRRTLLQDQISYLQQKIVESNQREHIYNKRSERLEASLETARLSNELAFQEISGDMEVMIAEREALRTKLAKSMEKNERLEEQLDQYLLEIELANKSLLNAQNGQPKDASVFFQVIVESKQRTTIPEISGFDGITIYRDGKQERYAVGHFNDLSSALLQKDELKAKGYASSFVIAVKDGKRVPIREALETASVD